MTLQESKRKKNVYIKKETQKLIEEFMESEGIDNHTEAVRKIIHEHHKIKLEKDSEVKTKLNVIDRNVEILTHLSIFMAESMEATKHEKFRSVLYDEAVEAREREIKRQQTGLMFNE